MRVRVGLFVPFQTHKNLCVISFEDLFSPKGTKFKIFGNSTLCVHVVWNLRELHLSDVEII